MALRFRRTVSIFPGVRLNLGKRGVSLSAGVRGASLTLGRNGLYGNAGIPGTGLSYREKLNKRNTKRRKRSARQTPKVPAVAEQMADVDLNPTTGDIAILDADGQDLGDEGFEVAKAYAREALETALSEQVDEHNRMMARIGDIHLQTPPPDRFPVLEPEPFEEPAPAQPELKKLDLRARLCPARKRAIVESNERKKHRYQQQYLRWQNNSAQHDRREQARAALYDQAEKGDPEAMEAVLDDHLLDIDWPRETRLSFELSEDGRTLMLDVDLPEIEDFPITELRMYQRGVGVSVNTLSDTAVRKLYMAHVHGMGFRLIGEGFACAPTVQTVVLSGFTQVPDTATGGQTDRYLYSVKVNREGWQRIQFDNLDVVDPVDALAAFGLRRDITKTGIFRAIEPWD